MRFLYLSVALWCVVFGLAQSPGPTQNPDGSRQGAAVKGKTKGAQPKDAGSTELARFEITPPQEAK
jgi:hypothetical protein